MKYLIDINVQHLYQIVKKNQNIIYKFTQAKFVACSQPAFGCRIAGKHY